jgi:hypothetical protein
MREHVEPLKKPVLPILTALLALLLALPVGAMPAFAEEAAPAKGSRQAHR